MSFGFSIGDIILLSQLAYDLYSTVSSGRKAASRDLKELEEVLFSLKCALDHLRDASKDVLGRPDLQHGRPGLKEKLDVMIESCASTLQELDAVTKKYRIIESQANVNKTNKFTLDDMKKSLQVNWQRVRWDREKQSLQQYREKLKSHTDAINLMLTSVIWANTAFADASSNTNHEKTQSLLGNILRTPAVDEDFRTMVQEMHTVLTKPSPDAGLTQMVTRRSTGASLMSLYAMSDLTPIPPKTNTHVRRNPGAVTMRKVGGTTSWKGQTTAESALNHEGLTGRVELPVATVQLNNERRAFGAREFETFKQRHAQPAKVPKPTFLSSVTPTSQDLQACIPHIFRSTADGKQQTQELKNEISRWTQEFSRFVSDGNVTQRVTDESILALLGALNEVVDSCTGKTRQLFYETSDSAGFTSVLSQVETMSKSVRVMKEIEEFRDTKEEWSEQTVR